MTLREKAKKGGETTSARHGREFYRQIGKPGGQKIRELIARGKARETGNG